MYNINSIFIPVSKNNEDLGGNIWETVPIYYIVILNRLKKKKKRKVLMLRPLPLSVHQP